MRTGPQNFAVSEFVIEGSGVGTLEQKLLPGSILSQVHGESFLAGGLQLWRGWKASELGVRRTGFRCSVATRWWAGSYRPHRYALCTGSVEDEMRNIRKPQVPHPLPSKY